MEKISVDFLSTLFVWQSLFLASIGFLVYCLIDILKNKFVQNDKIVWLLVVILLPILGSVLYVSIGRKKKLRQN
ncbi:hypothetical protein SB49_15780 [Sediminicola sp. YIK13]|uniref:PLDc N-terminal domain-containing protein n=1 Tax=Sediminicola sp. YIK13 TaxID=1453352 RepID=UPI00071F80B9|nr:PLDc N-terminal domain-containing protein [Sediminicola sp. YIK13]ALM09084.1 hypothetical protein SB49_15780 [Sediminicola sp. YIK13]